MVLRFLFPSHRNFYLVGLLPLPGVVVYQVRVDIAGLVHPSHLGYMPCKVMDRLVLHFFPCSTRVELCLPTSLFNIRSTCNMQGPLRDVGDVKFRGRRKAKRESQEHTYGASWRKRKPYG